MQPPNAIGLVSVQPDALRMPHLGTISSHFDLARGQGQRKMEQAGVPEADVCSAAVPTAALSLRSSPSLLAKQPGLFDMEVWCLCCPSHMWATKESQNLSWEQLF